MQQGLLIAADISWLIRSADMISGYADLDLQLQPAGFDLSVNRILTVDEIRPYALSEAKEVFTKHMTVHPFGAPLQPLRPYVLVTNEYFRMPNDITATCTVRSSLTRLGAILGSGLIDAGYRGHLSFSLVSALPLILSKNDRIAQVLFFKHDETFPYCGQYCGQYTEASRP